MYVSLFILLDIFGKTISFSRENINFVLVYDKQLEHTSKQYEKDETSFNEIDTTLMRLAAEDKVRFGLGKFEKLYFKKVHTCSKDEFDMSFASRF
ncbi:MAG: hypothetical protein LBU81_04955 [Methanosarcinales archaeon]|jgi:hypothetical protein|nr:hypothetical protein [Methanosarcinales archaeon]